MNMCWAWQASCDMNWAGWASAIMSAVAILASAAVALVIPHRARIAERDDARDAANTVMEEAIKRLSLLAHVASSEDLHVNRTGDVSAPLRIADEMLSAASVSKLGSSEARIRVIAMREHCRSISSYVESQNLRTLRKETLDVVASAWRDLHEFQKAIERSPMSEDRVRTEIAKMLAALPPKDAP